MERSPGRHPTPDAAVSAVNPEQKQPQIALAVDAPAESQQGQAQEASITPPPETADAHADNGVPEQDGQVPSADAL